MRDGTLEPWRFATPTVTVRPDGRPLAGPYADEEAMRAALAAALWLGVELTVNAGTH